MVVLDVETRSRQEVVRITSQIAKLVRRSGWTNGLLQLFGPHTTAGLTINENADPDVVKDLLYSFEKIAPTSDQNYRHSEGNSAAHVKASLVGFSLTLIVREGTIALGTWQDLMFCEFDGPRRRKLWVEFLPGA
ncbi:MAG TPA: secondary thiamine-phosphate synthase enzyme YjbQ [Chloroflexota bacterium]